MFKYGDFQKASRISLCEPSISINSIHKVKKTSAPVGAGIGYTTFLNYRWRMLVSTCSVATNFRLELVEPFASEVQLLFGL